MSTIATGNTITTAMTITGDITGNLVLAPLGNIVLSPGIGKGIVWANNQPFSSGSGGLTWASVQTANVTAVVNTGYPIDTTTSNITVTLPSTVAAGSLVQLVDYAQTWGLKPVTVYANGLKINGNTSNVSLTYSSQSVGMVYVDATKGWVGYTGFTSTPVGPYSANYLVVAGGGGGGVQSSGYDYARGGGGAGGYLSSTVSLTPGTSYAVIVGAGGNAGSNGSNSSLSPIATAIGGGSGGYTSASGDNGVAGGSGGGGDGSGVGPLNPGGSGTAGQGNAGGAGGNLGATGGGGGGGASAVGGQASPNTGGNGGGGTQSSISGTATYYAGGGGGGAGYSGSTGTAGTGGSGGGGPGSGSGSGTAATANTGGGGGGCRGGVGASSAAGGSGIVIIQYLGSQRGTGGTITSSGGYTIHTFTSSGTFVA